MKNPESDRKISMKNQVLVVEIDRKNLSVDVRDLRTGILWTMQKTGPCDIGIRGHSGPWQGMPFGSAQQIKWEGNASFQKATLSHWPYRPNVWSALDFAVEVTFQLKDDTLSITVNTRNGRGEASFIDSAYPRGWLFPEKAGGKLLLPYGQGCLLDKNFPVELDHTFPAYAGMGFVMPWWAQVTDSQEAVVALPETTDDIAFRVVTEQKNGHTVHPWWLASLGNFRYPRSIKYKFFSKISIPEIAKIYRNHAASKGLAITLKEKAKDRPNVAKLKGTIIINIWHESWFGRFRKENVWQRMSFAEGLRRFRKLEKEAGLETVVVHVDGWGRKGYDCLHPDILPPDSKIGGWKRLETMARSIQSSGHLFLLHDNYVDIYADSESFSPQVTVLDLSGVRPENDEWLGGRQQWLCPQKTMKFVRRNLLEVQKKIHPSATYLDCFTYSHLRECYDQRHPSSRSETRKAWMEIFAFCQKLGWATSSEGGADWAIPVLDFCHTVHPGSCPFDLREKLQNRPLGIPFPLYALVWHDCLVVPSWIEQEKPAESFLWGILWGGIPSVRPHGFDCNLAPYSKQSSDFVCSLKPMQELAKKVGFEEMVDWEMIDDRGKIQRASFGNGTQVSVNFIDGTYSINGNSCCAPGISNKK
ncbi:MAG TPA: DUF5696 domain-containing protein [bacterium]|nr:DUF5696 domain-containing protein [bacterium]HPO51793.1 DUF5696 domain-containing protein [bacterium]HXK44669.1 DUF5696 domain-containing protein [bacterium]